MCDLRFIIVKVPQPQSETNEESNDGNAAGEDEGSNPAKQRQSQAQELPVSLVRIPLQQKSGDGD